MEADGEVSVVDRPPDPQGLDWMSFGGQIIARNQLRAPSGVLALGVRPAAANPKATDRAKASESSQRDPAQGTSRGGDSTEAPRQPQQSKRRSYDT